MDSEQDEGRRRGWFGRLVGLAAIVGAGALWRQRQHRRDLDEELWGDPSDLPARVEPVSDEGDDERP